IMYTTNAIESVNSSFRKVTKKGAFRNEDAVFKIFYLRIQELYKKWKGRPVANWAMVRNPLLMDDRMSQLMQQYDVAY
ncbi:transposase, partial [Megasphaera sp.]|uniref:transposase n=1 Tax=Megasphaera sp. TaxID=2023260 RepID=UPI0025B8BF43